MANHTRDGDGASCGSVLECWFDDHVVLARIIATVLVLLVAWLSVRLAKRALVRSARRLARLRRLDEHQTKSLVARTAPMGLAIGLGLGIVAFIALLGIWGLQTAFTGLLAGAGFAGIVLGLAAADTIGDVVAGFLIFVNHPFEIGDWVEIDGVQGIVQDVALGATTLLTFDNEKVTIPNRLVEGSKVKNFSHGRKLRRRLAVGVEYGSDLDAAKRTLVEVAKRQEHVLKEPEPTAVAESFGPSSVEIALRYWVEPIRSTAIRAQSDLVHDVHDALRARGIGIAFPHVQVVQARPWRIEGAGLDAPSGGTSDTGSAEAGGRADTPAGAGAASLGGLGEVPFRQEETA